MIFIFYIFFRRKFFGVLHQAVRAVSKTRPKYPILDIPFNHYVVREARFAQIRYNQISVILTKLRVSQILKMLQVSSELSLVMERASKYQA
jgi:hypothetical protein